MSAIIDSRLDIEIDKSSAPQPNAYLRHISTELANALAGEDLKEVQPCNVNAERIRIQRTHLPTYKWNSGITPFQSIGDCRRSATL